MAFLLQDPRIENPISPNTLRTFLLSWLKQQGIEDETLQLYSGHENRYALEHYNNSDTLGIKEIQDEYKSTMQNLPFYRDLTKL